jgi:hypothetical protein
VDCTTKIVISEDPVKILPPRLEKATDENGSVPNIDIP